MNDIDARDGLCEVRFGQIAEVGQTVIASVRRPLILGPAPADIAPVILQRRISRKRCDIGMMMRSRSIDDGIAYNAVPDTHSSDATPFGVRLSTPLP